MYFKLQNNNLRRRYYGHDNNVFSLYPKTDRLYYYRRKCNKTLYIFTLWSYLLYPKTWTRNSGVINFTIEVKGFVDIITHHSHALIIYPCCGSRGEYFLRFNTCWLYGYISPAHGANARAHELHNCVRGFHYNHAFSFSLTTVEVEKTFLRLIHFHCMGVGREVGF